MEYIKIRNWERWQTYRKDRGQPPWIKIHRRIRLNPEWVELTDAERGQLVAIWLLAADKEGNIPASEDVVKRLCFMSTNPNLNKFKELGFLEYNDINVTPERRQDVTPKAEAKAETETKAKARIVLDYLNEKKGSKYERTDEIQARLNDGGTVEECLQIIDNQMKDEYFIQNPKYLNPTTLFRKSHWDNYLNNTPKQQASSSYQEICRICKKPKDFLISGECQECRGEK